MQEQNLSKFIAYILRHKPSAVGITLDGYKFFISENGVWQVDAVPYKYIKILG